MEIRLLVNVSCEMLVSCYDGNWKINILEVENDYVIFYYYFRLWEMGYYPESFSFCRSIMKRGSVAKMRVRKGDTQIHCQAVKYESNHLDQGRNN